MLSTCGAFNKTYASYQKLIVFSFLVINMYIQTYPRILVFLNLAYRAYPRITYPIRIQVSVQRRPHLEAGYDQLRIIKPGEDGGLGFIHLSHFRAQIWKRKPDCDGLAVWVIDRAIEFKELRSNCKGYSLTLVGFVEESNAILVLTASGVFMVYPQPMEFKKLSKLWVFCLYYPFASFYPAGNSKPLYNLLGSMIGYFVLVIS